MTRALSDRRTQVPEAERRQSARYPADNLSGSLGFDHRITVLDISLEGMALESNQQLVPGRSYSMSLSDGSAETRATGRIVWCRLRGTRRVDDDVLPVFRAGFRLEKALPGPAPQRPEALAATSQD